MLDYKNIGAVSSALIDIFTTVARADRRLNDAVHRPRVRWPRCTAAVLLGLGVSPMSHAQQAGAPLPDATVIIIGVDPTATAEPLSGIPGLTPIQRDVARVLDDLCGRTENQTFQSRCGVLRSLSDDDARNALQEIAPTQVPALGTSALIVTDAQLNSISTRLQILRHGSFGKEVDRFLVSDNGYGFTLDAGGSAGTDGALMGRLGVFVTGLANTGDKDTTERELGFDFDTRGVTTGLDYRLTDTTIIGGALGYSVIEADFAASGGDQETDAVMLSAYGTHYANNTFYVDWIISYSQNDYDTTRNLFTFDTQADSSTDGNQWALSVNAGAEVNRGAVLFSPYARIEYVDAEIDDYVERGGGGLAIEYDAQTMESLTLALGGRLSRAVSTSWAVLSPSVYLEWIHEFQDDARSVDSRFVEDPSEVFSMRTDDPDRNFFRFGVAAAATFARGRSAYISYDTHLDLDDVSYHQFDIGLRVAF